MPEDFNPRQAALNHAGAARVRVFDRGQTSPDPARRADLSEFASAIACGLVYVGDQLGVANGYLSGIANLLETLDASVSTGLAAIAAELQ